MSPYLSKFVISDAHVDLFILTFTLKFIPSFSFLCRSRLLPGNNRREGNDLQELTFTVLDGQINLPVF